MPSTTHLPKPGHAPGHLRDAFLDALEAEQFPDDARPLEHLEADTAHAAGLLWNCTDTMPSGVCADLELPVGSTYAQGARRVVRDA